MSTEGLKLNVDVTENVNCVITEKHEIKSLKVSGVLSVNNNSSKNRIWNAEIRLGGIETTSFKENILPVGEVQAGGKWTKDYIVPVEETVLKLKEIVDTCYESDEVNWALVYHRPMPVSSTITISNPTDAYIDNIKVRKIIPKGFGDPEIEPPNTGTAEFEPESREVVWKNFELSPGSEATLVVKFKITAESIEPIGAGKVIAEYHIRDRTRSLLNPDIISISDSRFAIEPAESVTQPSTWDCTIEFLNISEFLQRLLKVDIFQIKGDLKEQLLSLEPNKDVPPRQSWEYKFTIKSASIPVFETNIDYKVVKEVTRQVYATITKEDTMLPVERILTEKTFTPAQVDAYDKTPMTVTVLVSNIGSAQLDQVTIYDAIPEDFKPPSQERVKVYVNEKELSQGVETIINPNDDNPAVRHGFTVFVKNMKSLVGGVNPGQIVKCVYPMMAWEPKPEKNYLTPIRATANIKPPGPDVEYLELETNPPKIGIKYTRRAVRIYKEAVSPGAKVGQHVVPLVIVNTGEVSMANVTVKDFVPLGFSLVEWKPEELQPKVTELIDGLVLTWHFMRIEPGQEISLSYTIEGEGKYTRKEPQLLVG
ncbi:MAG: hypothetical protein ACUVXA_14230 [Candidatus Jordarchaeum sp.]|uniref:hypothetical protein n=1 Tax=Candidatus Jordarchaeum sp. TaxID=2823881 RepID=UPI00404A5CEC